MEECRSQSDSYDLLKSVVLKVLELLCVIIQTRKILRVRVGAINNYPGIKVIN